MTAQCFEIQIFGPMRRTEIDHRGEQMVDDEIGCWILPTPQAEAALDQVCQPYGISADEWLYLLGRIFTNMDQIPWALIALDREYDLAGHFRSIKGPSREMIFTAYSLRSPQPSIPVKPRISMLIAFNKDIVGRLASKSPLLASAWEALRDKSENMRWLCISGPLPDEWVSHAESIDDQVLAESARIQQRLERY